MSDKKEKKVVGVSERELIEMINGLVTEEVANKKEAWLAEEKSKWISENASKDAEKVNMLESKVNKLEKLISDKLK